MEWPLWLGAVSASAEEHDVTGLLLTLLILFAAAKLGAELKRMAGGSRRDPGVIVGPQVLVVHPTEVTLRVGLGVICSCSCGAGDEALR